MLKNSYFLGFLMLAVELVVNLIAGMTAISGMILSFTVGSIYAYQHKEDMPRKERMKALVVYFVPVILLSALLLTNYIETISLPILLLIAVAILGFYALLMYAFMGMGSRMALRAIKRAAEKQAKVS